MEQTMNHEPMELSDEEMGKVAGGAAYLVEYVECIADTSRSYTNIYFCNGDANGDQFKNNFMGGGGVCGVACWRCEKYDHFDRLDQEHANNYMSCFRNFERRDLTGGYTL